jgi:hypothetical protein
VPASHAFSDVSQSNGTINLSDQTLLTPDEITNYYLYGANATPRNLIDANLIRDPLASGTFGASIPVLDMKTFMTMEAGRFIRGRHFSLVNDFFTVEEARFTSKPDFIFGKAYSPTEIASFIGIDTSDPKFDDASIQQIDFADSNDDYINRVYIFNNSGFTVAPNSQFIVLQNGERRIDTFTIRPFDDNFDFVSTYPAQIANYQLEDAVDPSTIGQIVDMPIRENSPLEESLYDYNSNGYYDGEDYFHEILLITDWHNQGLSKLLSAKSEIENLVTNMWNKGTIRFLDERERPIIYGTNGTDNLDNDSFGEPNGLNVPELNDYVQNGVVLIGGAGDDKLDGNSNMDRLIGGKGNDTLDGGDSEDVADFSGLCSEYDFDFDASAFTSGTWTIIHARGSQVDGTDTLRNVEKVQFADILVALSTGEESSAFCTGQDITLVIDITGSMADDIAAVKSEARNIINTIFNKENKLVNSRIAIVGYRDPGEVFTILTFTEDADPEVRKTAAINAINSISVGGGGDKPEGVYSGLLHALNGGIGKWRAEAAVRRIILFGDAPPKDNELAGTVNKLASDVSVDVGPIPTASSVTAGPVPVEIFTIVIGSDAEAAAAFQRIAKENSGQFFTADTAADLTNAILNAVTTPPVAQPDLVVQNIIATEDNIQIIIKNQGAGSVPLEHDFWVDVYINPNTPPTSVNNVWDFMGEQGLVWGVVAPGVPMQPGATITLSIGDRYYWPSLSNFSGSIPLGTPIYAQVDSANSESTYGGVLESHESAGGVYNNIAGPVLSKAVESSKLNAKLYLPLITSSSASAAANSEAASAESVKLEETLPVRP